MLKIHCPFNKGQYCMRSSHFPFLHSKINYWNEKGRHRIQEQKAELIVILDSASCELTQPHSNLCLRLIPLRWTEKCLEHFLMSTAILRYSAPCHGGSSVSEAASRPLRPATLHCLHQSIQIVFLCFCDLVCSRHPLHPRNSDLQLLFMLLWRSSSRTLSMQ